jgi:hypothetical protein
MTQCRTYPGRNANTEAQELSPPEAGIRSAGTFRVKREFAAS